PQGGSDPGQDNAVRFGDVNGDGLVDLVRSFDYSGTLTYAVYLNNRSGWSLKPGWRVPEPLLASEHGHYDPGTRLVDVNGDGIVDIVRAYTWNFAPVSKVYL